MLYAVCTECAFLRAYARAAAEMPHPDACPQCGAALVIHEKGGRFPPTYVSRVSLDLLATPELESRPMK